MALYHRSLCSGNKDQQPQIRLLHLLPGARNDPICCHLKYEYLVPGHVNELQYDALSYCWGDDTETTAINLEGASFNIRVNLYSALNHIRSENHAKLIWVDAICINQEDAKEKNEQVALMRQIYSFARSVLIWVGEATSGSSAAFRLISDILAAQRLDKLLGIESRNLWDLSKNHWGLPLTTNPVWYDLFAIIQRPWFRRAWVIQELAVASEATIMCGHDKVLWTDFAEVFAYLVGCGLAMTFAPVALVNLSWLDHARKQIRLGSFYPALHVLMWHRQTYAADPRDKLFAFLGLIDNDDDAIKPEYEIHVRDVYKNFAVRILQKEQNLDIFSVPRVQDSSSIEHLPTWVPDWSVFDRAGSLQLTDPQEKPEMVIRAQYTATGSSKCHPIFKDNYTRLGLKGAIIDRILFASLENPDYADQPDLAKSNDPQVVIDSQRIWKKMEDISMCRVWWTNYPTGENIMDAYWQTLLGGTLFVSYDATKNLYHRTDQQLIMFRLIQLLRLDRGWVFKLVQLTLATICYVAQFLGLQKVVDYFINWTPETTFRTLATLMLNRVLIRTEAGFIGLAPKLTREDEDYIALCEGGRLPLVVRPKGDEWEVIGDCYIHGIMQGQAYDLFKDQFKTMWFV